MKRVEIGFKPLALQGEVARKDVFYVKDNGIGIKSEFYNKIFEMFTRLHGNKVYGDGTGAGLSFVKKIVERHGGCIWLESLPGKGTTFFFTLKRDIGKTSHPETDRLQQ
jgi:signal transduction histidine kinase